MTNKAYVAIGDVKFVNPATEALYDLFGGSSLDTSKWTSYSFGPAGGSVSRLEPR